MADPTSIIADAFEKLKRSISQDDAQDFASTELKDVWHAVREIDAEQRKRHSAQYLRRIEPLLKGIEKYAQIIEVLCNGTPYMPYVWAPIKLMLQLASQHRDIFDALLMAYVDIGAALPRFDRYEKAFKENPEFQKVLAIVYSGILDFHQRAYKFFRRRAWHNLFLSLWKDFGSRFRAIIDGLKQQRDFVDKEATSIDIAESKDSRSRVRSLQDEIQGIQQQQRQHLALLEQNRKHSLELLEQSEVSANVARLQHAVAWLSIDERDQETRYERICHRRHDETCVWVMRESHMESWVKDDTKHPILWLSGKPGGGKSVMCSYIIQKLSEIPALDTCYYFCNSQDTVNLCSQVLRTVTLQLLRRHPDLASLISNEFVYQGVSCGMSQLKMLIPKVLEIASYTRIVIDGIDECPDEDQRVIRDLQTLCLSRNSHCKILYSSRREVQIAKQLSGKPQILLDGREEVEWDICIYVKHTVRTLRTANTRLLNEIESILVEKSDGMFLWARLVVEELQHCFSEQDLEEQATRLPKGLKEAYGRILQRIMRDNASALAIRILEWMACSCRPLKSYEILDGISFRPGRTRLDNKIRIQKEVLDICRPLIEDGPSDTINFVHFSAKEYVLKEEYHQSVPFIVKEEAMFNISFSCITYLNTSLCLLPDNSTPQEQAAIIVSGFHGLQLYANAFWIDHFLSYCDLLAKKRAKLPDELLSQLSKLLEFQKKSYQLDQHDFPGLVDDLDVLTHFPRVKNFISMVTAFRAGLKRVGTSNLPDKSPSDLALESCASDPTYFSTIRHCYQSAVESLLDHQARQVFPGIDQNILRKFVENYGPSGFICRYINCTRATDGFDSSKQRDAHEATHQRKFRCSHPSCVSFSSGFATRSALNKHNDRYHSSIDSNVSLLDCIASALENSKRPKADKPDGSVSFDADSVELDSIAKQPASRINGNESMEPYAGVQMTAASTGSPPADVYGSQIPNDETAWIKQFRLDAKHTIENNGLFQTTQDLEDLLATGRAFNVDIPEVSALDKMLQQMKWNDRARNSQGRFLTLKDVSDIIEDGVKLEIPSENEFLDHYNEQRNMGMTWETKAKALINAEFFHYPQLKSLSYQAQAAAFPVCVETLAAIDQILNKQREAHRQIISLYERSKDEDFSKRPKYSEVREAMEHLTELNSKPDGIFDLEKEQKRHEDWMRTGKKLFGIAVAPLHILKSHMEHVLERNIDCFDINHDKPRLPAEPASREPSPSDAKLHGWEDPRFKEVFCICRRIEAGMMIECRLCHEWYHGKCLKIARGKVKEDEKYTCPICDWRVKIPRDAARPKLEDLQAWQDEIPMLPFQPNEEQLLEKIINNAQEFRHHVAPFCNPVMATAEEAETQRFYLRKIEGAEILLLYETNFFRQELHKLSPVAPEQPPVLDSSKSTRKPRPTKLRKLMAQYGVDDPEALPHSVKVKNTFKRKSSEP